MDRLDERRQAPRLAGYLVGLLALALPAGSAFAYSTTLDLANNSLSPPPFANVTITGNGADFDFAVTFAGGATGSTMEQFGFNVGTFGLSASDFSSLPANWSVDDNGAQMDGFGMFDIVLKADNGPAGVGSLAFTVSAIGDSIATYTTDFSSGGNGGFLFAAKLASSDPQGAFIAGGSPVPVPAAAWLFASGLVGLIGLARKKAA